MALIIREHFPPRGLLETAAVWTRWCGWRSCTTSSSPFTLSMTALAALAAFSLFCSQCALAKALNAGNSHIQGCNNLVSEVR